MPNKNLENKELNQVNGGVLGLSSSEWKELQNGELLFLAGSSGNIIAKLQYYGDSWDPSPFRQQRLKCKILELYGVDYLEYHDPYSSDDKKYVNEYVYIPRGDLMKLG